MASGHWNIPFLMTYCPYILDFLFEDPSGLGCDMQVIKSFLPNVFWFMLDQVKAIQLERYPTET